MTNPFNCPPPVFAAMETATDTAMPILAAVRRIGPARVQWAGQPRVHPSARSGEDWTCWALDGRRAKEIEILKAGGQS